MGDSVMIKYIFNLILMNSSLLTRFEIALETNAKGSLWWLVKICLSNVLEA